MTHNGGQPHRVGYTGQSHKITVHDAGLGRRRVIGWSNNTGTAEHNDAMLRGMEECPSWSDAKLEPVENTETGDA